MITPEAYSLYLKAVRLDSIHLIDLNVQRLGRPSETLVASSEEVVFSDEFCDGRYRVKQRRSVLGAGGEEEVFRLEFGHELDYIAESPPPPGFLDQFAKANLPILLFPYERELVANLTMRMGFPPVLIPHLIIPPRDVTSATGEAKKRAATPKKVGKSAASGEKRTKS